MVDQSGGPVGDAEREQALRRLTKLHEQGVLGPHDFEDRRGRVRDAVTRSELDAVFRDLPVPDRQPPGSQVSGPARGDAGPTGGVWPAPGGEGWFTKNRRDALSWIVVLGAVVLFFTTKSWLWFLLIPASAALWQLLSGRKDD